MSSPMDPDTCRQDDWSTCTFISTRRVNLANLSIDASLPTQTGEREREEGGNRESDEERHQWWTQELNT